MSICVKWGLLVIVNWFLLITIGGEHLFQWVIHLLWNSFLTLNSFVCLLISYVLFTYCGHSSFFISRYGKYVLLDCKLSFLLSFYFLLLEFAIFKFDVHLSYSIFYQIVLLSTVYFQLFHVKLCSVRSAVLKVVQEDFLEPWPY